MLTCLALNRVIKLPTSGNISVLSRGIPKDEGVPTSGNISVLSRGIPKDVGVLTTTSSPKLEHTIFRQNGQRAKATITPPLGSQIKLVDHNPNKTKRKLA
jgi:hypothetical protein